MMEIASRLGVSRVTVSNALRGKGRVSPEVAERIRSLAADLHYIPIHAGRALRTGRSATIGLIVPDFGQPLFPVFAQAIERAAKRRGFAVLVGDSLGTAADQASEIDNLIGRGVDALAIIPTRGSTVDASALPVPVAIIDSAATPFNTASSDHREGGRQAARHLLGLGHREILTLAGSDDSRVANERLAGLREAFDAAGIAAGIIHSAPSFEAGAAIGESFEPGRFTACAAVYDALAVGFSTALSRRRIRIPEDVSITGFDDLIWGRIVSPPLTTIRQDLGAIADHALAVITGERSDSRLFPVELVIRGSTAPLAEPSSKRALQPETEDKT